MVERCPGCNYRFEREEGFFLGAYVVNLAIGMAAVLAAMIIGFAAIKPTPSAAVIATGAAVAGGLSPILAYPFTKTIWTSIDTLMLRGLGASYDGRGEQPGYRRK
jgi:hypothetical protein